MSVAANRKTWLSLCRRQFPTTSNPAILFLPKSTFSFATLCVLRSGHNRWSKIKHDKAKEDAAKNRIRSVLSKELTMASRLHGPDPKSNPRLELAVTNAKKSSFPKVSIEAAIARGQGLSSTGTSLESLTIEALLPSSVAAVIECQTDSKARTLQDLRTIIKYHSGTVTSTSYLFQKKGKIVFAKSGETQLNDFFDVVVDAGAENVDEDGEGRLVVYTEPDRTNSVARNLSTKTGLAIESLDIVWDPNADTMVDLESDQAVQKLEACLSDIQDDISVQDVYLNAR